MLVDSEGKPLVFSHFTDEGFNAFDINKARANSDVQAFFFAPSDNGDWMDMGSRRMDVYLNIRNPKKGKPIVLNDAPFLEGRSTYDPLGDLTKHLLRQVRQSGIIRDVPIMPEQGTLNLREILKAEYLFS